MDTHKKKIIFLLIITFITPFFSKTMDSNSTNSNEKEEKQTNQKSIPSLLDFCKIALFKEYYNGLDSIKKTYETFSAKFALLPEELREALIEHFNHRQLFDLKHTTWSKIEHITLKPEDYDRLHDSHLAVNFPQDTQYYSFSLDQTWIAFSSLNATVLNKWNTQQQRYTFVRSFSHPDNLPQKICFSSDNSFLVFEFSPEIILLKNEDENFPDSTIIRFDKNQQNVKYLVGFSQNNLLVTHHADYARLDFWDFNQKLPWVHSIYFPRQNRAEQDCSAHIFTNPSRTSFYYINDDNELYTNDNRLDFPQVTVKLALEKYMLENNLIKIYELKKSKKLNAFNDPHNGLLMQKYIEDALEMIGNSFITRALQRMWEYNEAGDIIALRSLLSTIFPSEYKNQDHIIRAQKIILKSAQDIILQQKAKTNKNKIDLLNTPLLVLFEKNTKESTEIDTIKMDIFQTIKTLAFQLFKNLRKKRRNNELLHFFNCPGFSVLNNKDQKKLVKKGRFFDLACYHFHEHSKENFFAGLEIPNNHAFKILEKEDQQKLITKGGLDTLLPFKKNKEVFTHTITNGLRDLLEPEISNPNIIQKTVACAA